MIKQPFALKLAWRAVGVSCTGHGCSDVKTFEISKRLC